LEAGAAEGMVPPGEPAGKLKTVRFTVSDVQMAPDAPDAGAMGAFSLRGEGVIGLMTGMDQQPSSGAETLLVSADTVRVR